MSEGPTIYSVVMNDRTNDLFKLVDAEVRGRFESFLMTFVAAQEEAIRKAYIRGVRDGFAQGVAALDTSTLPEEPK